MFESKYFALVFTGDELHCVTESDNFRAVYEAARLDARSWDHAVFIGRRIDGKVLTMFNVNQAGPGVRVLHKTWKVWCPGKRLHGIRFCPSFEYTPHEYEWAL